MEWNNINSPDDIEELLDTLAGFHDSCIKEMHLATGIYVDEEGSMCPPEEFDPRVRLLIHSQFPKTRAIEMLFEQVVQIRFVAVPPGVSYDISEAELLLQDGIFYWSDRYGWRPGDEHRDDTTWIGARALRWREMPDWLGSTLRYGPADAEISP